MASREAEPLSRSSRAAPREASHEARIFLLALGAGAPGAVVALVLLARAEMHLRSVLALAAVIVVGWIGGAAAATTSVLRLYPRSNGRAGGSGTGPCGCRIGAGAASAVGAVSAVGASATAARQEPPAPRRPRFDASQPRSVPFGAMAFRLDLRLLGLLIPLRGE